MVDATGEADLGSLRVDFDARLKLEFHGSRVTSDAGLLAFRELDDALGLSELAGGALADSRPGRNGRHTLLAQFRQSVFGRLAGYEDVNDAAAERSRDVDADLGQSLIPTDRRDAPGIGLDGADGRADSSCWTIPATRSAKGTIPGWTSRPLAN